MPLDTATQTVPLSNDGSLSDAVLHMPDIDDGMDEPNPLQTTTPPQPRNPKNGQWKEKDARQPTQRQAKAEPEPVDPDAADPDQQGDVKADEASEVNDEFFELPPEKDGEQPRRIKAEEVWQGYQERERLRAELEDARRGQPPPEAYDQAIYQAAVERQQLVRQLQMYAHMIRPEQPDMELINEESPRYNPGLYQRQMAMAQQRSQQLASIQQEIAQHEAIAREQQAAVGSAQFAREQAKLHSFWPEIRDPKEAMRVRDDLVSHYGKYGITPELIGSIHNSAFYALAKDALAYRRSLQAREAAVKVVRAKPKLVKGQARAGDTQKATAFQTASRRLAQTNSLEDAADALGALL